MSAQTIFALATARGRAGIAVIRLSGPDALTAAAALAGALPEAGRSLRRLHDGDGEILDEALVLTFAPRRSFTGEAVVEFQCHGSMAVVSAVLGTLGQNPLLRPAEAGEFTRRALENGRLDLARVEGLADLIDAETEAQRRHAVRVFGGALRALVEGWRADLLRAAALIEATIDFADEDVPVDVLPEVAELLNGVMGEVQSELRGIGAAERLREGFEVAIVGRPNLGKSTLLNRLAGRDAAITSTVAGTTRDVIEVRMDLAGLPVTLLDTAGLRESADEVERIGVERAKARAAQADLRVHLVQNEGDAPEIGLEADDIILVAKSDSPRPGGISGVTGAGVEELIGHIGETLSRRAAGAGTASRARHRRSLLIADEHLGRALELIGQGADNPDLIAEELRRGIRALEEMVGRIDVEEVLGEIFSSFCIGK
ncbi:tRNA uridine-5-carboxymethylaminomethyl(34) synthesis GTPase MnmE [Pseudoroseicyclus aestuarii]|uniref:tRNA modification GTPase MnmE n=1 Tax=Pseudoroseicyclus aestuarii TaxID=1795041 RepID=A0A318SSE7_9RHOB|nr:tRNA uridine-5-carboxymethylaminomethyl(34) synthesis GTPase MnmE [Pseudoroseicyclus aestuarii]PYE84462.1 tRNA modification GTPase trmE [Pseudoroseicyclus aestuarii]